MKPQTSGAWRRTTLALHSCATRKSRKAACFHLHAFGILCPSEGINELTNLVVMARLMLLSYSRTGSGGKANAKVWQRWAVSMGFPVLPLLLSTLQPRLPMGLLFPSASVQLSPPLSFSLWELREGRRRAGSEGRGCPPAVRDQRRSPWDRVFTDISKRQIRPPASSAVTAEKGVISRVRGGVLSGTWAEIAKQGPFRLCRLLFSSLQED